MAMELNPSRSFGYELVTVRDVFRRWGLDLLCICQHSIAGGDLQTKGPPE